MSIIASSSSSAGRSPSIQQEWSVVLRAQDGRKLVLYNSIQRRFNLASIEQSSAVRASDELEMVPARTSLSLARFTPSEDDADLAIDDEDEAAPRTNDEDDTCPLCGSLLSDAPLPKRTRRRTGHSASHTRPAVPVARPSARLPPDENSYFALLSDSRMGTPTQSGKDGPEVQPDDPRLSEATMNTGYFDAFFKTIDKLGQGSNGSVYLVQHVLNNEPLGLYACKKVAVGDSTPALLSILREVHLLETLQDPHVISYHHAWIELCPATPFAPAVPTLFILMSYANGGSLDDFVRSRRPQATDPAEEGISRSERIRFMRMKKLGAVHLFRVDEILSLFEDVTEGLAFLHSRNILHLDLKAANVLLHWDEDALLPTAKLCDFGSSDATLAAWSRTRTGISGTLEYSAPESWTRDIKTGKLLPATRARDLWALGLILHLLCYFELPWKNDRDIQALENEIRSYPGFLASEAIAAESAMRHDLPMDLLTLLADLVHRDASRRPRCDQVLTRIRQIRTRLVEGGHLPVPVASTLVRQKSPSPPAVIPSSATARRSSPPNGGASPNQSSSSSTALEAMPRPSLRLIGSTGGTLPPARLAAKETSQGALTSRVRKWLLTTSWTTSAHGTWSVRIGPVQLVLPRRTRRQALIVVLSLVRLLMVDWACRGSPVALSATMALYVLALVEVVLIDLRLSCASTVVILAISASSGRHRMCRFL